MPRRRRALDARRTLANVLLLLTAGNETTTNLLGNGLAALLRDQINCDGFEKTHLDAPSRGGVLAL